MKRGSEGTAWKGNEELSTLTVYGGTSDVQARDDKTKVISLG